MKPNGVQRSVRAQRFDREAGDAPNLGRVGRSPGTGLPKGQRRRKKHGRRGRGNRERNSRRRVILTWSVVLALLTFCALGMTVWLWLRPQMDPDVAVMGKKMEFAPEVIKRVASKFESPSQEAALDLVKRAIALRDPVQVPEMFRLGSAIPAEVVDFLSTLATKDGAITSLDWLSSVDANGLLLDGVNVCSELEGKRHDRLALLTPDEKGRWKIDFDAFARTVHPAWSELRVTSTEPALVRVLIALDTYYNGPFRDDKQWVCYGMISPDLDAGLLGYCRRGSPQAAALARIVEDGQNVSGTRVPNRATLQIRGSGEASSKQFEITQVLAQDWVMSSTSFDQNFK